MQNNLAFQTFKHCSRSLDEKTDTNSTLAHTVPISAIIGSKLFLLQRSLARRYWACTSPCSRYHKLAPQVGSLVLLLDLMDFWASPNLGLGIVKYHSYFGVKNSIIPFFWNTTFYYEENFALATKVQSVQQTSSLYSFLSFLYFLVTPFLYFYSLCPLLLFVFKSFVFLFPFFRISYSYLFFFQRKRS